MTAALAPNAAPSTTKNGILMRLMSYLVAALSALVLLAGCATAPEPPVLNTSVEVTGDFAAPPVLQYQTPIVVETPSFEVIWEGDGPIAEPDHTILLNMYGQNGMNRAQLVDTFYELPRILTVSSKDMSPIMLEAISGQRAGSRILIQDITDGTPIVLVVDMLSGQAAGETIKPQAGLPKVTLGKGGMPTVTIPPKVRETPPSELIVQPLIRGNGKPIASGDSIIVQYTALTWSNGKVIDSTWSKGRPPFSTIVGDSRPIQAWDEALIEQPVGSQVLMIAPPPLAYQGSTDPWAEDTIVFAVDILWAGTLDAPDIDDVNDDHSSDEGDVDPADK